MKRNILLTALAAACVCLSPEATAQTSGAQPTLIGTKDAAGVTRPASPAAPIPIVAGAAVSIPVEGKVAEGAAATSTNPVVGGMEARALGALPAAVHAGDAVRAKASTVGVPYQTVTDPTGTVAAVAATGAAVPGGTVIVGGSDGANAQPLSVASSGVLYVDPATLAGHSVDHNKGDVGDGSQRVTIASVNAVSGHLQHDVDNTEEHAVWAGAAGTQHIFLEVANDTDGAVCCALAATTAACSTYDFLLEPSPAALQIGGRIVLDNYSGPITCRAMGAWTTTVVGAAH